MKDLNFDSAAIINIISYLQSKMNEADEDCRKWIYEHMLMLSEDLTKVLREKINTYDYDTDK